MPAAVPEKENAMKVLFINNEGSGYASHIDVEPGTTVARLFAQRLPDRSPDDFLIRVNRESYGDGVPVVAKCPG